jgi:DNA repair protein RecO (recombination protein O)
MPTRERSQRVEAVVLRHNDWGEADRLLVLYTLELGKIRVIAKGVRKLRSRKAGHLEPFTRVTLQLARGRDMPIVTQAETLDAYLPLRDNFLKTTYAAHVVELLDRFTYEEGDNPAVYRLLVNTLEHLAAELPPEITVHFFRIRLLNLLGYRPQLFQCSACAKEIQPVSQFFSAEQGGVLCPECGKKHTGARPISVEALRYLRHFQRSSFQDALKARLSATINREMESLVEYYLTYILERGLNTPPFLRRARAVAHQTQNPDLSEPQNTE